MSQIKLSILVPSVAERRKTFLPGSLDMLYSQLEELPIEKQKQVEILYLVDNKTIMLGDKRNMMAEMATGEYVIYCDDDDLVDDEYISELLKATDSGADCIVFKASVTINGGPAKTCTYDMNIPGDYNTGMGYYRVPNHICAIKRSLVLSTPFPSIKFREDCGFSKMLKPKLKTQHVIDRVLYTYNYNDLTTVSQEDLPLVKRRRRESLPVVADIVMLSNAKTDGLRKMTETAIRSAIDGANQINVNVIVIEQQPNIHYEDTITVYHSAPFNYSVFNNLGARQGNAEWIVFLNNDTMCRNGWLHGMLSAGNNVVSAHEPRDVRQSNIKSGQIGYQNGVDFSPWAFAIKRDLFNLIGGFDEDFRGWLADDALIERLKDIGYPPMITKDSIIEHMGSVTTNTILNAEERSDFAWDRLELFNNRYNQNKFHDNPNYFAWKQKQNK